MTKHIRKEYVDILTELYPTSTPISEIASRLNISKHTVQIYARKLGLKRQNRTVSNAILPEHAELIKSMYEHGDLDVLSSLVGKSKHAISEWCRRRKLRRQIDASRKGDISTLLDKSLQSFYWLGMLASDGYISKDGHLMFSQGEKDKDVVFAFAEYTKSSVYEFSTCSGYSGITRKVYRVNIKDAVVGRQLRELWGLKDTDQKTYSSITSYFIENEQQAKAFFIGFFDGDGSMQLGSGKLELHSNWLHFLNKLVSFMHFDFEGKINKRGYAIIFIKRNVMRQLKQFIINNNILHNPRKWDFPLLDTH
jgi:DNA-binding transcriptional regulator WhiA